VIDAPKFKPPPAEAERLTLHQHTRRLPGRPSKFVDGLMLPSSDVLICPDPACSAEQPVPEHGLHFGCRTCSLKWVVFGNSLSIWRDRPKKGLVV
jgi:hypothetical protein